MSDNPDSNSAIPSRRTFFKTGLATALGAPLVLTSRKSLAQGAASPATIPWTLPIPPYTYGAKAPVAALTPEPQLNANTAEGECGRDPHQAWNLFSNPDPARLPVLYEMHMRQALHQFNEAYPLAEIWGFDGLYPGPVLRNYYRKPCLVRIFNDLPSTVVGFGTPEISTHLHNMHTPSDSDGFPGDFFSRTIAGPTMSAPGDWRDHYYPMVYAGYEDSPSTGGDYREALGTLWYHDHCLDFTAANVVRGMAGYHLMYDHIDSGNENDPNPAALRLPSGAFDIPLMFQDLRFDGGFNVVFDQLSQEGTVGDKIPVNGVIEPYLEVEPRKYRFRLLNGGPSRTYQFQLITATNTLKTFTYISNDGNLLPAPLRSQNNVRLGVAERADIIVDFTGVPQDTVFYVITRLNQLSTRQPETTPFTIAAAPKLLKIIVNKPLSGADNSRIPSVLRPLPPLPSLTGLTQRTWVFDRSGVWTVNGQIVDVTVPRVTVPKGQWEIWTLVNNSTNWLHPVHIHFEEGRILSRTLRGASVPVPAHEKGRKDVYVIGAGESVTLAIRFRDFPGRFVTHCHNVYHEDHAMMFRWDMA
jgi:FtsP/CotA-like multicopper oxidase with cupredoxin domain